MTENDREKWKRQLHTQFEAHLDAMIGEIEQFERHPCAATLYRLEKEVNAALDRFGDEISAGSLAKTHAKPVLQAEAVAVSKKNTGCTTGGGTPPSSSSTAGP
jgi:hypothetical protein